MGSNYKNVSIVQVRDSSNLNWGGSDGDESRYRDSRDIEEAKSIGGDKKE